MKKTACPFLAVFLTAMMLLPFIFIPSSSASNTTLLLEQTSKDNGKYYVDVGENTDILAGLSPAFSSPGTGAGYKQSVFDTLTDGVYAKEALLDLYGVSYVNISWCKSADVVAQDAAGPQFSYSLTDGTTGKYYYCYEWSGLSATASSFSLWFNNETAYSDYVTNQNYSYWQVDSEFVILVSQNNGLTYTEAYHSTPYVEENGKVITDSARLKTDSVQGDWEMFDVINENGVHLFRYRQLKANFSEEYTNVTNIVYGVILPRRNPNNAGHSQNYVSRLSEIDVYSGQLTETTEPVITDAQTETVTTKEVDERPSPDAAMSLDVTQINKDLNDGYLYIKATVKNNNSYAVTVKDVAYAFKDNSGSTTVGITGDKISEKIGAGEEKSFELKFNATSSDNGNGGDMKKSGCKSAISAIAVIAVLVVAAGLILLSGKKGVKICGILVLVLCSFTVFGTMSLKACAESTTNSLPKVSITTANVAGESDNFKNITSVAEITDGDYSELKADATLENGSNVYPLTVTVGFIDYEIIGAEMRAIPYEGIGATPVAIQKGYCLDLRTIIGTGIPVSFEAGETTFSSTYPEKIYTSNYTSQFMAIAGIKCIYRGDEVTVWSSNFSTSVEAIARKILQSDSASAEDKAMANNIILYAGNAATLSAEDEMAIRSGIVQKMEDMASVIWTCQDTIATSGQVDYSTPTYTAGTTYRGLIYNNHGYGTAETFKYYLDNNGKLGHEWSKDLSTLWNKTPGVSCSTSLESAIAYYTNGLKTIVGAVNLMPTKTTYGFSKIGAYEVPEGAATTEAIIKANNDQTMYEAYAGMKTSDILLAVWLGGTGKQLGHTIMLTSEPLVVRNPDGTINPNKSEIETIEQHSTIVTENGYKTTWMHVKWTFAELLNGRIMKFVPIQYTSLINEAANPSYTMLSDFNAGSILKDGLKGTLESNYPIRYIGIEVTDKSGQNVYETKYVAGDGYKKAEMLSSLSDINTELKALPAGEYNVKLSVCTKNAVKVLYEGTEVK